MTVTPEYFRLTDDPQFSELDEGNKAFLRSLDASDHCMDKGTMNGHAVAVLVAMDAEQREREAAQLAEASVINNAPHSARLKVPGLMGCWIDGKLRFQSRDHEAVRGYAADKITNKRNGSLWLAPVGSFQS